MAFIPALVISSLGLVAGVVLAVSGDPEWVNVLIIVAMAAPIAFAGKQVCGWTRQDSVKPAV